MTKKRNMNAKTSEFVINFINGNFASKEKCINPHRPNECADNDKEGF